MGLEISPLRPTDGTELADLFFDSYADDPAVQSSLTSEVTDGMKRSIADVRTKSIESASVDPDLFELCARDTESGEVASEITFRVEHSKDGQGEEWKELKCSPWPEGFDSERLNGVQRKDWNSRIELMGVKPHMYISRIRTSRKHQRRGAASMLLKHVISQAASLNLPIYITGSPAGYKLYEKHGFELQQTFLYGFPDVPAEFQTGYCMIRPAPSTSSVARLPAISSPSNFIITPLEHTHENMLTISKLMDSAYGPNQLIQLIFGNSNATVTLSERADRELALISANPSAFKYFAARDAETGEILGMSKWYFAEDPYRSHFPNNNPADLQPGVNEPLYDTLFNEMHRRRDARFRQMGTGYMHLAGLLVHPKAQRMGLGGKLLSVGLDLVDEMGRECIVDASPVGLGLYKKWGWEEYTRLEIDLSKWGGEGLDTTVGLIRQPGAKRPGS